MHATMALLEELRNEIAIKDSLEKKKGSKFYLSETIEYIKNILSTTYFKKTILSSLNIHFVILFLSLIPRLAFSITPMVSAGYYHTLALNSDGSVLAWGNNNSGQIGDGTSTHRYTPITVPELGKVKAISAGGYHSVALKSDGTVVTWGWNIYGQLGDETPHISESPMEVPNLRNIVAISAGEYHTVALKSDGTVLAWGKNVDGQLGDNTTTDRATPKQVLGLSGVVAVSAGYYHTAALKSDGTVVTWGKNSDGQLGDGTTTDHLSPFTVPELTGVIAISAGQTNTFALKSDGTIMAWGNNESGQLGDGTTSNSLNPIIASGSGGVKSVSAGQFHTVALKLDGTVLAWGYNGNGELGVDSTADSLIPIAVQGLNSVVSISTTNDHTVAIKSDGTVVTWGWNPYGQLGNGNTTNSSIPLPVSGHLNLGTVETNPDLSGINPDGTKVKSNQKIIIGIIPKITMGSSGVISVNNSSGLPVEITSKTPNVCSINNDFITAINAGSSISNSFITSINAGKCILVFNQAGNVNYKPAKPVKKTIEIGKAIQSITLESIPSIVAGESNTISANSSSHLTVSFSTSTPSICKIDGTSIKGIEEGICVITATQKGNNNYKPAPSLSLNIAIKAQSASDPKSALASFSGTYALIASDGTNASITIDTTGNVTSCKVDVVVSCSGKLTLGSSNTASFQISGDDGERPVDTKANISGTISPTGVINGNYLANSISEGTVSGSFSGSRVGSVK